MEYINFSILFINFFSLKGNIGTASFIITQDNPDKSLSRVTSLWSIDGFFFDKEEYATALRSSLRIYSSSSAFTKCISQKSHKVGNNNPKEYLTT